MQFTLIAFDGKDEGASKRRMDARGKHLSLHKALKEEGHMIYGGAILDEDGNMVGSNIVAEFDSRKDLDDWLKDEPYVTGEVWKDINIYAFKLAVI